MSTILQAVPGVENGKGRCSALCDGLFFAGQLLDTYHQLGDNAGDEELISSQTYNERDELEKKEVGEYTTGNYLQTIDYAYNLRGWLTDINDFSADDLFSFKLHYNELNANVPSGGANYNGNISQVEWQVKVYPSPFTQPL